MKKILMYSLAAMLFMVSCRKSDNPKLEGVIRVPLPKITIDKTGDLTISAKEPDAFAGKFDVGLVYPDDVKPAKVDIVVMKNDSVEIIKVLKADVSTFPTALTVTGVQLKQLFGESAAIGDSYQIGANITTTDGKLYPAFAKINGKVVSLNNAGVGSLNGSSPTITYSAVYQFHMEEYGAVGTTAPFTVTSNGWEEDPVNGLGITGPTTVPVTIIDDTHLSFVWGPASNPHTIIVTIDPLTNTTSVAKQVLGDYGAPVWGGNYGNASITSVKNAANNVTPGNLGVSIHFEVTVAAGSFGEFTFAFKKQ
nr:hypothetical protein [Mucilaginibacter sp. L294]